MVEGIGHHSPLCLDFGPYMLQDEWCIEIPFTIKEKKKKTIR